MVTKKILNKKTGLYVLQTGSVGEHIIQNCEKQRKVVSFSTGSCVNPRKGKTTKKTIRMQSWDAAQKRGRKAEERVIKRQVVGSSSILNTIRHTRSKKCYPLGQNNAQIREDEKANICKIPIIPYTNIRLHHLNIEGKVYARGQVSDTRIVTVKCPSSIKEYVLKVVTRPDDHFRNDFNTLQSEMMLQYTASKHRLAPQIIAYCFTDGEEWILMEKMKTTLYHWIDAMIKKKKHFKQEDKAKIAYDVFGLVF